MQTATGSGPLAAVGMGLLFGLALAACSTTRVPAAADKRTEQPLGAVQPDTSPLAVIEAQLRAGPAASTVVLARDGDTLHVQIPARRAFAADQFVLLPGFMTVLDEIASELRRQKPLLVVVTVHTDATGTEAFNLQQSQQRAQVIAGYLVEHGLAARSVSAVGAGESAPLPAANSPEGREQNRRVDIAIGTLSS